METNERIFVKDAVNKRYFNKVLSSIADVKNFITDDEESNLLQIERQLLVDEDARVLVASAYTEEYLLGNSEAYKRISMNPRCRYGFEPLSAGKIKKMFEELK